MEAAATQGIGLYPDSNLMRQPRSSPEISPPSTIGRSEFQNETTTLKKEQRQPSTRHPKIREACFEDYTQIAALQSRNGLATRSREEWAALWIGNPVFEQRRGQWPIGWVLETEGGALVGFIGNLPVAYSYRGQDLVAATGISWVVDPGYRGYSMSLLGCILRRKDVDFAIGTTISANAEQGYRALGWSRVPVGAWDKSEFWITNYRGFSESVLRMKSIPLSWALSYPAAAGLFLRDKITGPGMTADRSNSRIEPCGQFDSRFDDFWAELKHQNHNVLLAVRSRETLDWHFQYSLRRGKTWILAFCEGSRLSAYAIFNRQDNPASHLQRVRLIDFQALRGFEAVLPVLLGWGLQKCREQGIHILESVGCWAVRPGLPKIPAPYSRTLPSWSYYYKANSPELRTTLKDPAAWVPTSFDGDASL